MMNTAAIVTTPRIPAQPVMIACDHGSRSCGAWRRPRSHWVSSTQAMRVRITAASTPAHASTTRDQGTVPSRPVMMETTCMPISRKTACSSRNATVDQVTRSVIRDPEVWTTGSLCPMSRPATTTEITPEAWISSAAR